MEKTTGRFRILLSLTVLIASVWGITHRQQILDAIALYNYTPDARVVALASDTTMKEDMRRVFYIHKPQLNDKPSFREKCETAEQSIVLGCYVQHRGIYLLDVTDPRLNGVIEVTAAHESLHAAYDRLSRSERQRIDGLTSQFFATLSDERIKKTVEQYRSRDPAIVPNELHSILGTEVRDLTPELEEYYSRYFEDRKRIVEFSEKYEQTFVDLSTQVENYDEQLRSLKETIDSNQVEIEGQNRELEQQKTRLDALMSSGRTEEYNTAVPEFNSQVNSYNALVARTRSLIAQYNDIVEKRNAIATAEQELIQAINTNVPTVQTQ